MLLADEVAPGERPVVALVEVFVRVRQLAVAGPRPVDRRVGIDQPVVHREPQQAHMNALPVDAVWKR